MAPRANADGAGSRSAAGDGATGVRKPKRPKKPRLPPSVTPWPCTILAVDPGERSGWAIRGYGHATGWGECDLISDEPAAIIASLLEHRGPHIVVVERPFRTRFGTQVAVGAGDLVWRRLAERAGLGRRIVRVWPASWRARVLGGPFASAKRDVVKARELEVARGMVGNLVALGPESAPALLISQWAAYAGEVGAVLPKPRKGKVVAA